MFFLELKPTLKCNQTCYYCDVHGRSKFEKSTPYINTDYLRYILSCHGVVDLFVQVSGGEVGLLSNVDEFFNTIYDHPRVKYVGIESNGLLRKNGFDFNRGNTLYSEHLIFDIDGQTIKTFYKLGFERINKRHRFVIVSTEKTVDSILNNFNFYKDRGLFRERFWFKIIVPKSYDITFLEKLYTFYEKLNEFQNYSWELFRLDAAIKKKDHTAYQKYCAINPPQPFIDFERTELVHCGVVSERGRRFKLTRDNIKSNMQCNLFGLEDYCKTCYVYDYGDAKVDCILRSKRGDYCNRSYI